MPLRDVPVHFHVSASRLLSTLYNLETWRSFSQSPCTHLSYICSSKRMKFCYVIEPQSLHHFTMRRRTCKTSSLKNARHPQQKRSTSCLLIHAWEDIHICEPEQWAVCSAKGADSPPSSVWFIHSENAPEDIYKHINAALLLRVLLLSLPLILLLAGLRVLLLLGWILWLLWSILLLLGGILLLRLISWLWWLCLISWLLTWVLC